MQIVSDIIGDQAPVHGVLCFVEADWPLLGGSFSTRGVEVLWPKKLSSRLGTSGPLDLGALGEIHRELAIALLSA